MLLGPPPSAVGVARPASSGKTRSMRGRRAPEATAERSARNSRSFAMVEPRIESCFQKIRRISSFGFGPRRRAARHDASALGGALAATSSRSPRRPCRRRRPRRAWPCASRMAFGRRPRSCSRSRARRRPPAPPRAFSSPDVVAMTRAPQSRAISTTAPATPPPTPWTRTVSPGPDAPRARRSSARPSGRPAETPRPRRRRVPAGIGKTLRAGTTTSSANVPGDVLAEDAVRHAEALLAGAAELAGVRSRGRAGGGRGRRASRPPTPSPSASTTPAPSPPGICGSGTSGIPLRTKRSRWFSAAARIATRTSPAAGRPASGPLAVLEDLVAAVAS